MSIQTIVKIETKNNQVIELLQIGQEYCIDSRNVAPGLGIEHKSFIETLRTYQEQLEYFGSLPFETAVRKREIGATQQTYAMLNRNQVLFAITLSRNTDQVIGWKMALIDALDQLDQQVKAKQPKARQKQVAAPKDPPIPLEEKIITRMTILAGRGICFITPAVLSNRYMKSHKKVELRVIMDKLVVSGQLVKICTVHAPFGKYSLA